MGEMGHNLVSARELAKSGLEDRMTVRAAEKSFVRRGRRGARLATK